MKKNKIISILCVISLISIILGGCSQDYTKNTPFDKSNPTAAPSDSTPAPDEGNIKDSSTNEVNDPKNQITSDNDTPSPSKVIDDNNNDTSKTNEEKDVNSDADPSPTAEPLPTTTADDETSTIENTGVPDNPTDNTEVNRDSFNRDEYWERTFLIWLPMFNAGSFSGQNSAGTFDYATFTDVSTEEAKNYITSLKSAGFSTITTEEYSDSSISFAASNDQNWQVQISLTGNTLVLGSGFEDKDSDKEDLQESLYSTTMLQYMPRFTAGDFVSSETSQDSNMFTSILYANVSKADVLSYIEQVKSMGYIYAPEDGDDGDSVWYIALNEESFECHVEFSGSDLKIGCGYLDED